MSVIDINQIKNWKNNFENNSNKKLLQNIISNNKINSLYTDRDSYQKHQHLFSHKVTPDAKVTNQKSSGRCWLFAALNVIRRSMIEKYKIKDFEFSQSYLFFWDKLERLNYNLECIIKTKNENIEEQLVQHILSDPTCDGGQWDMVVNLIEKYGLVPQSVYKESHHSSNSGEMNAILTKKFRDNAKILRNSENPEPLKKEMMQEYYNMLCQFLGTPPDIFEWNYEGSLPNNNTDTSNNKMTINSIKNLTPLEFYKYYVDFKCNDYVCVINDPRVEHPYNRMYSVKYLGNIVEGHKVRYLNLDIKELKSFVLKNIKENNPVWFGCDVGKWLHRDRCAMDLDLINYFGLFGTEFSLTKEERIRYKDSLMTHAMVISGANIKEEHSSIDAEKKELVDIWQVENSWDNKGPALGYYIMTDNWFDEYVYEIVVHKKYLSKEQLEIYNCSTDNYIILDPWDPMGSLA
jgi:bleomycin hydrolase